MDRAGKLLTTALRLRRRMPRWGGGSVWLADHLEWNRRVAVQLLDAGPGADQADRCRRLQSFVRAQARVDSSRIAGALAAGLLDDGRPYAIVDALEGASLAHRIGEGGALPLGEVGALLGQIGHALRCAHDAGVVHGGLHADSVVLLDAQVVLVKLVGFAWVGRDPLPLHGDEPLGPGAPLTVAHAYLSPEQVMGKAADARADVWALGVLAYHALSATAPFAAPSLSELARSICEGTFVPLSTRVGGLGSAGPALDAWFARALCKNRTQRFSSVEEMLTAWQRQAGNRRGAGWAPPTSWDRDEDTQPRFELPKTSEVRALGDEDPPDLDEISDATEVG